ncbi:hypothetical protein LCGC14_2930890, partial [marine sediment metagenome]
MKFLIKVYTLTIIITAIFLLSMSFVFAFPAVNIIGNYGVVGTGIYATTTANANFTASGTIAFITLSSAGSSCLTIGATGLIATTTCGGSVAGSNTQVQFNNGGVFGASSNFTYNLSTDNLTVGTSTANSFQGIGGALTLERVSGSTFSTIQDMQNIFHSVGWISGGDITDDGDGTITVADLFISKAPIT